MFERIGATWLGAGDLLVNHDGIADSVYPAFVTRDVLPGLGVHEAGRHFTADEDRRGAAPVLLLSDRAWRQTFAADRALWAARSGSARRPPHRRHRRARLPRPLAGRRARRVRPAARDRRRHRHADELLRGHQPRQLADGRCPHHGTTARWHHAGAGGGTPGQPAGHHARARARGARTRLGLTPLDIAARTGATKAGLVTFARLLAATVSLTLLVGCGTVALLLFVRVEGGARSSRPASRSVPRRHGWSAASRSRPPWWRGPRRSRPSQRPGHCCARCGRSSCRAV